MSDHASSRGHVATAATGSARVLSPSRGRRRGGLTISLNLTPMIDVVFLLIFFFLTVSRFGASEGVLPAELPARAAAATVEVPRVPIRVRFVPAAQGEPRCRVTIDRFQETPIPIAELADRLAAIDADVPGFDEDTPVILMADLSIAWDDVVNAYNASIAARYRHVYFATDEPAREGGR